MRIVHRASLAAAVALVLVGCGGTDNSGMPTQISKRGGDGQPGAPNLVLPLPVTVLVQDKQNNPVTGISVSWTVLSGGGTVESGTTRTDAQGVASNTWTLGPVTGGDQQLQAKITGSDVQGVVFTSTVPSQGGGAGGGGASVGRR